MNQQKKITSICVWIAIILFVLRCIISWESILEGVSAYDLFGYAGEAISAAVILSGLYEIEKAVCRQIEIRLRSY